MIIVNIFLPKKLNGAKLRGVKKENMKSEKNMYPLDITLKNSIADGAVRSTLYPTELLETDGAITLRITVNSSNYPKAEVRNAVKEICQKVVEYFD